MNQTPTPESPSPSIGGARRRRLLIGAALALLAIVGICLLDAEHRSKVWGLWPILFFAPIPLLTWLNQRREETRQSSRAGGDPKKPKSVVPSPATADVAKNVHDIRT